MHFVKPLLVCVVSLFGYSSANPQQRCGYMRCHNSGYNGAFYPSSSSWSNGGYYPARPMDVYPSGGYYPGNSNGYRPYVSSGTSQQIQPTYGSNSNGYRPYVSSGISQQIQSTYGRRKRSAQNIPEIAERRYNSYGNSYNKAGICPLYGRRRRSVDNKSVGGQSRYYSNGNHYYGGSSTYYCNSDRDCTGNLKCCSSYGQQQCTYPHYSEGVGSTSGGFGFGR